MSRSRDDEPARKCWVQCGTTLTATMSQLSNRWNSMYTRMSSSLGEGVLNRYWQTVLRSLMITSYRQTVFGIIIIIIIHEFHRDASLETKLQALFRLLTFYLRSKQLFLWNRRTVSFSPSFYSIIITLKGSSFKCSMTTARAPSCSSVCRS